MASKLVVFFFVALIVVATAFELADDLTDDEIAADMEFMKRADAAMQDLMAEKRAKKNKYRLCATQYNADQECWCTRRGDRMVYCTGTGVGVGV